MGSGKSSVGPFLARAFQVPFVDLDAIIENKISESISSFFKREGEPAFRSLERTVLKQLLEEGPPQVIALGGGALLDRAIRLWALDRAVVVTLEASLATLVKRLRDDKQRPLLGADTESNLRTLIDLRRPSYSEAHIRISTDDKAPQQVASELEDSVRRHPLAVAAAERSYPVWFGDAWPLIHQEIRKLHPSKVLVVTDTNVNCIYGEVAKQELGSLFTGDWVFGEGESSKTIETMLKGWEKCQHLQLDRKSLVLAIGGGLSTDIGGFLAATWLRGIRWLSVPTSMLGMVDASVGGKTGVDLGDAKNVIGAFHQPSAVVIDTNWLRTEPSRSFRSGIAEVVKSALVGDLDLLSLLEALPKTFDGDPRWHEVVRRSVAVKAWVVSRDETEQGERAWLNLGHTLGHALESAGGFSTWTHGEAVSMGMMAALRVGHKLGLTQVSLVDRVQALLHRFDLPTSISEQNLKAALALLGHDKKRVATTMKFVLVDVQNSPLVYPIEVDQLRDLFTITRA